MSKLQLSSTPPLGVPLRFFQTAPLFGIGAAALFAWGGAEPIAERWSPSVAAHALDWPGTDQHAVPDRRGCGRQRSPGL